MSDDDANDERIGSLQRALDDLRRQVASLRAATSEFTGPFPRLLLVKDGDDEGQWQEQTVYNGEVVEWPAGRRSDVADDPSNPVDPDGAYFLFEFRDVADGDSGGGQLVTRYVKVGGEGLIPVDVEADAGDGDATPFTYTFTKLGGGDPLGTAAAPAWAYETNLKKTAATHGTAYRDADGTWVLYQVDEVPDDTTCTP